MDRIWLRKIGRELATNWSRTALTVLSIAVGLFAVSLTFRTQAILSRNVLDQYAATVPAAILVRVQPTDPAIIDAVRRLPGVRAVAAVNHISTRVLVGGVWRALALRATDDPAAMRAGQLELDVGAWPRTTRGFALERSYLQAGAQIGDQLPIELPDGRQVQLPLTGAVHDLAVISGRLGNPVLQGYISRDTALWLTGADQVNELLVAVDAAHHEPAALGKLADAIRAALRRADATVIAIDQREPDVPETYVLLSAVFQTLNVLGALSLALSAFLVVNTISAMLARHVAQIGVMKAIGARSTQVFTSYLVMVLAIAALALAVALPAAAVCARLLAAQLAWLMNYAITDVSIPAGVIALEGVAGILTPVLASLYPIGRAARVTVRQAIAGAQASSLGAGGGTRGPIGLPGVPIAIRYAARSMFRRKARLALTLVTLICGGAIEITVISAQASLAATLDQVSDYWQQDLTVSFSQPERAARVVGEALRVPGVAAVEQQSATLAVRRRADGSDSADRYAIFGIQPASALIRPTLLQGRWLLPTDRDAIVVNVELLKREPGLALGDRITLAIDGRTTSWQVVGVVTTHLLIYGDSSIGQGVGYVSGPAFTEAITRSQRTNRIIVTTSQPDPGFHEQVGKALETHFAQFGVQALVQTRSDVRSQIGRFVSLIVLLLSVMALSFVAIGALSLVGAMSLNVLERTREIGVLRAIGAPQPRVTTIVIIEGICVGLLSWGPATLLALPLSKFLSDVLGWSILSWPLVHIFPLAAPVAWLGMIVALSAAASYLPARRASRMHVRDALEYL